MSAAGAIVRSGAIVGCAGAERFGRARAEQFPGPGTEQLGHPVAERGAIAQSQLSTCSGAPVQLPG